ncbi:SDR family NAD(P)-dependent oxidoreductase [Kineococcus aurantiacus]|uniref:NADP-dependent 3-hydroxy acid dehydrogenase YdfG n=1 Tax=Kineococcus aurantiacus TaxID=37633 RepID=A0A7Y9DLR6_9ACTN|nr:NADP-dependent 3-hydroxy acid dehydrogenase YdfG [Kineococcus aurantiacus]
MDPDDEPDHDPRDGPDDRDGARGGRGRAVVVGASSAIGAAVAHRLHRGGWSVEAWGRDPASWTRSLPPCVRRRVDVTRREDVEEALERGRGPLTTLVYAAGLFDWADTDRADPGTWDELFEVNLTAAARVARLAAPALLRAAPSSLVLLGSTAAHRAFAHNAAYVASKHGLLGLADAVRADLSAAGVAVSIVNPGMVAAGASLLSDRGREDPQSLLRADDVAEAVHYAAAAPPHVCVSRLDLLPRSG